MQARHQLGFLLRKPAVRDELLAWRTTARESYRDLVVRWRCVRCRLRVGRELHGEGRESRIHIDDQILETRAALEREAELLLVESARTLGGAPPAHECQCSTGTRGPAAVAPAVLEAAAEPAAREAAAAPTAGAATAATAATATTATAAVTSRRGRGPRLPGPA